MVCFGENSSYSLCSGYCLVMILSVYTWYPLDIFFVYSRVTGLNLGLSLANLRVTLGLHWGWG